MVCSKTESHFYNDWKFVIDPLLFTGASALLFHACRSYKWVRGPFHLLHRDFVFSPLVRPEQIQNGMIFLGLVNAVAVEVISHVGQEKDLESYFHRFSLIAIGLSIGSSLAYLSVGTLIKSRYFFLTPLLTTVTTTTHLALKMLCITLAPAQAKKALKDKDWDTLTFMQQLLVNKGLVEKEEPIRRMTQFAFDGTLNAENLETFKRVCVLRPLVSEQSMILYTHHVPPLGSSYEKAELPSLDSTPSTLVIKKLSDAQIKWYHLFFRHYPHLELKAEQIEAFQKRFRKLGLKMPNQQFASSWITGKKIAALATLFLVGGAYSMRPMAVEKISDNMQECSLARTDYFAHFRSLHSPSGSHNENPSEIVLLDASSTKSLLQPKQFTNVRRSFPPIFGDITCLPNNQSAFWDIPLQQQPPATQYEKRDAITKELVLLDANSLERSPPFTSQDAEEDSITEEIVLLDASSTKSLLQPKQFTNVRRSFPPIFGDITCLPNNQSAFWEMPLQQQPLATQDEKRDAITKEIVLLDASSTKSLLQPKQFTNVGRSFPPIFGDITCLPNNQSAFWEMPLQQQPPATQDTMKESILDVTQQTLGMVVVTIYFLVPGIFGIARSLAAVIFGSSRERPSSVIKKEPLKKIATEEPLRLNDYLKNLAENNDKLIKIITDPFERLIMHSGYEKAKTMKTVDFLAGSEISNETLAKICPELTKAFPLMEVLDLSQCPNLRLDPPEGQPDLSPLFALEGIHVKLNNCDNLFLENGDNHSQPAAPQMFSPRKTRSGKKKTSEEIAAEKIEKRHQVLLKASETLMRNACIKQLDIISKKVELMPEGVQLGGEESLKSSQTRANTYIKIPPIDRKIHDQFQQTNISKIRIKEWTRTEKSKILEFEKEEVKVKVESS